MSVNKGGFTFSGGGTGGLETKASTLSSDTNVVKESTALTDITGLSLAIGASSTEIWRVTLYLLVSGTGAEGDAKFGFSVPTSCTMKWGSTGGNGIQAGFGTLTTSGTPIAIGTESSTLSIATISGTIGASFTALVYGGGTAGTVQPRFAQVSSKAEELKILKGSLLEAIKVAS